MKLSPARRSALQAEYRRKSDEVFEAMFGEDRQDQLVTMTQREDCLREAGKQLYAWLLAQHLEMDEMAAPGSGDEVKCPKCGRLAAPECRDTGLVPRRIATRAGPQEFKRRKYRCAHCRTVFFPLGSEARTRS